MAKNNKAHFFYVLYSDKIYLSIYIYISISIYIYMYIYIYTPAFRNTAISEIYIIYIYECRKKTSKVDTHYIRPVVCPLLAILFFDMHKYIYIYVYYIYRYVSFNCLAQFLHNCLRAEQCFDKISCQLFFFFMSFIVRLHLQPSQGMSLTLCVISNGSITPLAIITCLSLLSTTIKAT